MERACETSVELVVPFHDVDALGVVWHGHYYKYFELARTQLLRDRGLDGGTPENREPDGGDLIGTRYRFYVIESRCRHSFPLRYGERARVAAWVRDVRHRVLIQFELTNLDHERRAARGFTALATVDADHNLLLETPNEIQRRLLA
jgi:acyl-CoA thioester hydrolase